MKILVVPWRWYRDNEIPEDAAPLYWSPNSKFWKENCFVSVRNSTDLDANCAVPVDGPNVLKVQFDDVVEDSSGSLKPFDEGLAAEIAGFFRRLDGKSPLFVNCGAGISRSGAIGEVANEWFNKYLERNVEDDEWFRLRNRQVLGSPLVRRLLRDALFGKAH